MKIIITPTAENMFEISAADIKAAVRTATILKISIYIISYL